MRTLLRALQTLHRYQTKDIALQLGVTEDEYKQIESGELQMSLQQITALAELVTANTPHPHPPATVAVYNYNFGTKSRAIHYPNSYTENDYTNKPQNHENTNPPTNG